MKSIAAVVVVLALSACASGLGALPALAPAAPAAYILGPGDSLQITVYQQQDLSGSFRISDNGTVALPLVGSVRAQGLTVTELQRSLGERLEATAVKSPDVTISVTGYRPFFILGEVKNPGLYPYIPNMTVLAAVAVAGGFTYRAVEDQVSVTRTSDSKAQESRATRDSQVLPGDVVYVFERHL